MSIYDNFAAYKCKQEEAIPPSLGILSVGQRWTDWKLNSNNKIAKILIGPMKEVLEVRPQVVMTLLTSKTCFSHKVLNICANSPDTPGYLTWNKFILKTERENEEI